MASVQPGLDRSMGQTLPQFAWALAALYALLAVAKPWTVNPDNLRGISVTGLMVWHGFIAAWFFGMFLWIRRRPIGAKQAHPFAVMFTGMIALDSLLHMRFVSDLAESTTSTLLILGIGMYYTRPSWYGAGLVGLLGMWAIGGLVSTDGLAAHANAMLVYIGIATVLSMLAFASRRHMLVNLEEKRSIAQTHVAALEAMNQELGMAKEEMEAFANRASHDLRSPLAALQANLIAMERGNLEQQLNARLAIGRQVDRMSSMIEDLLVLSKIHTLELVREPVSLTRIAHEVADALHDAHPDQAVDWQIDANLLVSADARLVGPLLENLLGNAHKFTSNQQAPVIQLRREGQAFVVQDNGPGFDPADQERMFQPFERLHSSEEFGGHGIGLATVKRIIEAHGGTIHAQSTGKGGATFRFSLGPDSQVQPDEIAVHQPVHH